jgi:hypothetical protein
MPIYLSSFTYIPDGSVAAAVDLLKERGAEISQIRTVSSLDICCNDIFDIMYNLVTALCRICVYTGAMELWNKSCWEVTKESHAPLMPTKGRKLACCVENTFGGEYCTILSQTVFLCA